MFVGIGIGVRSFAQLEGGELALGYMNRVIADGGTVEAVGCLISAINYLS